MFRWQSKPTLQIFPYRNWSFVIPSDAEKGRYILEGVVKLLLHKSQQVHRISISFKSIATLRFPDEPNYQEKLIEQDLDVPALSGQYLCPGEHEYTFCFTIPHNAAPHELCAFGKVEQLLTAEASVEGIGVVIASWNEPIFMAYPVERARHSHPPALDLHRTGISEHLGAWRFHAFSPFLTQASLLGLSFTLEAPSSETIIYNIRVAFIQHCHLASLLHPERKCDQPVSRVVLLDCRKEPQEDLEVIFDPLPNSPYREVRLTILPAGQAFAMTLKGRAPRDLELRPTTLPGTITPIRMSHQLSLQIAYSSVNTHGKAEVFQIVMPVTINSCACLEKDAGLPNYSSEDPLKTYFSTGKAQRSRILASAHHNCTCYMSTKELMDVNERWTGPPTKAKGEEDEIIPKQESGIE